MSKRTKVLLVVWVFLLLCQILLYVTGLRGISETLAVTTSRTLVTAAHLGDLEGYERVYVDEETDFAVYVKDDYTADSLCVGDVVSLTGTTASVVSVSSYDFEVDVDNISKIVPGVSGSPVYLEGKPVGFVSGWNGAGALRCIFY